MDPLKPPAATLVKLGSLVVHYEEWTSGEGHELDKSAIDSLRNEPDVIQWFEEMSKMSMLPVKR